MRMSRGLLIFLSFSCWIPFGWTQDSIPYQSEAGSSIMHVLPLKELMTIDSVFYSVTLPEKFSGIGENCIIDPDAVLDPFLEQLRLLRAGMLKDTVRIVHIGDSHVRGHIYPQATGEKLKDKFGAIAYTDMGVNGATSLTFVNSQYIAAIVELSPDLLILSFGTNESHDRKYNSRVHYNQIDELVRLLRKALSGVPVLLTTPPGAYESFRQKNRRRVYSVNPRTATAVETITRYADKHSLAVWDLFAAVGGGVRAARNWKEAGLMRPDHVHYLPEGYVLQGELLYEAIIKQYNEYVSY